MEVRTTSPNESEINGVGHKGNKERVTVGSRAEEGKKRGVNSLINGNAVSSLRDSE